MHPIDPHGILVTVDFATLVLAAARALIWWSASAGVVQVLGFHFIQFICLFHSYGNHIFLSLLKSETMHKSPKGCTQPFAAPSIAQIPRAIALLQPLSVLSFHLLSLFISFDGLEERA